MRVIRRTRASNPTILQEKMFIRVTASDPNWGFGVYGYAVIREHLKLAQQELRKKYDKTVQIELVSDQGIAFNEKRKERI